jgi:DNA-binding MarR family transcriptional regulator
VDELDALRHGIDRMRRMLASRRIHAHLAEVAGVRLNQQALQVLRVLPEDDGVPVVDAARRAGMDVGAVSRQLRALEAEGLATRHPSPDHGSVILVRATPEGVAVRGRVDEVRRRQFSEALAGWSPDDCATLGRLMDRLVDDLQRVPYRP